MRFPVMLFTKITGWIGYRLFFGYKLYYDGTPPKNKYDLCRGKCIIIPNHTHIFDALMVENIFFMREIRTITAEVMFEKNKPFAWFLKKRGHIEVKRGGKDENAIKETRAALERGEAVTVFAEGRLPHPGENEVLPFHPGAVLFALQTGAPVLPLYFRANYRFLGRTSIVVGKPIDVALHYDALKPEKEAVAETSEYLRSEIIRLEGIYKSLARKD